jgi:L-malate glycosyltransferase
MKIMQITSGMIYGGAEKQTEEIMLEARRRGHEVAAITAVGAPFYDVLDQHGFKELYQVHVSKEFNLGALRQYRSIIQNSKPDIVNAQTPKPLSGMIIGKMLGAKFKLVATRRMTFPINAVSLRLKWRSRQVDKIFTNTGMAEKYLRQQGVRQDKLEIILSGTDLSWFTGDEDPLVFRKRLEIPADAKLIIKVANFYPWKGYDTFVDIARTVCEKRDDVYFAGIGSQTDHFFDQIKPKVAAMPFADRILFPGFVNDMPNAYAACDLVIHCTLEGDALSGSLREGMAMGKPVIGSIAGGNPELITDGETGLLYPAGDANAGAEAVLRLLDDKEYASRLAQAGKKRVVENLTIRHMVDKTMTEYEKLLAR